MGLSCNLGGTTPQTKIQHVFVYYLKIINTCLETDRAIIRDVNINIQKIRRIQTKNMEVFKITRNFNGTKLARNRKVAKFGCQNGQKCLQK